MGDAGLFTINEATFQFSILWNRENVTDKLGELGMGMSWAKQQKQQLKFAKRCLKSDYKVRTTKNLNKILINRIYKRTMLNIVL